MAAPKKVLSEVNELREKINHHNFQYHSLDAPEISDAEFDRLFHRLKKLEEEYPDVVTDDSQSMIEETPSYKKKTRRGLPDAA